MFNCLKTGIIILMICICGTLVAQTKKADHKLYFDARKKVLEQKWEDAGEMLDQLSEHFPNSAYRDDAAFWSAYCMEKLPDRQQDAYNAFARFLREFPASSYADDAIGHQISLAEQFVLGGQEPYRKFLQQQLKHNLPAIRQQAALSLGRLQDSSAVEELYKLTDDPQWSTVAKEILDNMGSSPRGADKNEDGRGTALRYYDKSPSLDKPGAGLDFLSEKPTRYRYYQSMLRAANDWSRVSLIDFGLWHILPIESLKEYYSLQNDYDRQEWLRKFWKDNDPTLTTSENEFRQEFERRIFYSRANFGRVNNYKRSKFLRDQYLHPDWPHAPWDARGEMYIKYGEPTFRSFVGFQQERWTYNQHDADFIVRKFITNIYGNAIKGNRISNRYFNARDESAAVTANYINREHFYYAPEFNDKAVEGLHSGLAPAGGEPGQYRLTYSLPAKAFAAEKTANGYRIEYVRRFIILDEDMREVQVGDAKGVFTAQRIRGRFEGYVDVNLSPGSYLIGIRLTDVSGEKFSMGRLQYTVEAE